jgi:NAD(P)-dependent dehydrogenase (short-subunit alcohol dehydrogenase family)
MLDINVTGTFIVDAHIADAINKPLNHPDGTDKHAPFWTSDEERGVIINFASAAANPYARVLSYGPTKTAVIGITKCELTQQCHCQYVPLIRSLVRLPRSVWHTSRFDLSL